MEERIASLPGAAYSFTNDATAQELQIAVENSMTGISWLDTDGKFRIVRDGYAKMLGYQPEELVGKSWEVTVVEADLPGGRDGYMAMLKDGQVNVESRALRKDGSIFYKKLLLVKTSDADGRHTGHYCFMSDVTELKETQRRIEEAERLRTVGMLAGGIAHDLNNLLGPILGFSDLLMREPSRVASAVETIREASERAQKLTQRLLDFSRREPSEPGYLCLNRTVEMAVQLTTGSLPAGVDTALVFDAHCTLVHGEEVRVESLIMNLMSNAGYAMRDSGGTITIRLSNPAPGRVVLSVGDDGPGIPVEQQTRIFEPFFTTKPSQQGAGLGLYMVKETVDGMRGEIDMVSIPGEGTTFSLAFDCQVEGEPEVECREARPGKSDSFHILVVDDQHAMLGVCEAMLEHLGHSCALVTTPEQAIARVDEGFDLVLADYRIGGASGLTLAENLRDTGLPVILMSGHMDVLESLPEHIVARLHKPFDIDALEDALRTLGESR